jgi:hypothetical protein
MFKITIGVYKEEDIVFFIEADDATAALHKARRMIYLITSAGVLSIDAEAT